MGIVCVFLPNPMAISWPTKCPGHGRIQRTCQRTKELCTASPAGRPSFAKDTYLVGTVRKNASTLPTVRHPIPARCHRGRRPTQSFRDPFPKQNVPRGYSVRYHDGPLTAVKWKDTRTLIVLSTATSVGAPDVQITRRSKGRGGGVIRQKMQCPAMVDLYNRYYKAVDKADQLRSSLLCRRPTQLKKSAKKLPAHKTAQLRFHRALVRQLVGNFSARRRAAARNPPVVNPGTGPVIGEHEQVRRGKPTRACRYCAKARRLMPGARRPRPHETIYKCNTCKVYVCRVSLRPECWREHLEEMRTVT
ncbi:hypothetical protein Bbelb_292800 [Branchiostoma belcheri]|nr:hypothetical protein Bbelb_292800 [Branchiostoma belcheri]